MDIISHGLWTGAIAKAANEKIKKPLNFWAAVWWGVSPDLFAFTIPFLGLLWNFTFRGVNLADIPGPSATEPPSSGTLWIFQLATVLYNISHSAIIFLIVFGLVWLVLKRPVWEMGGWIFHVFLDVLTHSFRFFPTPVFWPLFGWKFNGISWANPQFLAINYAALILLYLWFFVIKKRKNAL
ncbi:MAG: hypothetical protein HYW15_03350 [Candidatus Giovannonibacteria bacterium]|nr:MAG: hypothetical protein HYW15_03350 [Candidatus Giovannonibacteria bacterium]